jgi:thioesterase domain-containing protein
MAAYHVAKLRAVRPHGPYLLGGMCAGGVIAYEMARQLQSDGERVAFVALLDAADAAAVPRAWWASPERLQRFSGVFRERGQGSPARRALAILGYVPLRTTYLFAERDYRPDGRFDGELVLFRATAGIGPDEPYIDRYDDPLLGWGGRAARGARAIDVPGGHSSMLQEPHVATLAGRLQACIEEALADEPPRRRESALAAASRAHRSTR